MVLARFCLLLARTKSRSGVDDGRFYLEYCAGVENHMADPAPGQADLCNFALAKGQIFLPGAKNHLFYHQPGRRRQHALQPRHRRHRIFRSGRFRNR